MYPMDSSIHPTSSTTSSQENKRTASELDNIRPINPGKPAESSGYEDFRHSTAFSRARLTKAPNSRTAMHQADHIFRREMQTRGTDSALMQDVEKRFQKQKHNLVNNLNTIYGDSIDEIYGTHYSIEDALEAILPKIVKAALARPDALLQRSKESKEAYLQSNERACATVYLDKTCGSLSNIDQFIETLKKLNIDMVHFLPTLYPGPEGVDADGNPIDDDGGYSINSHREVNPRMGSLPGESHPPTLEQVFQRFLKNGIRVITDFTINHTSEQSKYYKKWKEGVLKYKNFYMAVNHDMRQTFDEKMISFFPLLREGNFTYDKDTGKYHMNLNSAVEQDSAVLFGSMSPAYAVQNRNDASSSHRQLRRSNTAFRQNGLGDFG